MARGATQTVVIDEGAIGRALARAVPPGAGQLREVLERALELKGLSVDDVVALSQVAQPRELEQVFEAARRVKDKIYGARLVIFAPLYISNLCHNDCLYCAFRARNAAVARRALTQEEIAHEVRFLVERGHKRILLVAGEAYPQEGFSYVLKSIETIYATRSGRGEIRRVNVNVAPLSVEEFRELKGAGIGTYQLFQETYHRDVYARVHRAGPKRDYDWRLGACDRAMQAGIDDVGVGVLFGLCDWRFELLAMLQHVHHLERTFGVGPHTISVPRLEPAAGSDLAGQPPAAVTDLEFRRLVAILRLAVPYTGIILSTRETPRIRRETFALGVSQISAGSRTDPGGYSKEGKEACAQFELGDTRPLDEVVRDLAQLGYIPSFCTGCYRRGRTGADFMDLAKPGAIQYHCQPNALSTFVEYLCDYASPETRAVGEALVSKVLEGMEPKRRVAAEGLLARVRGGERDVYV